MALRSFAILSILASAVAAQSNPLIPEGISASCTSFLTALNNNTGLVACTTPFTTALAPFAPGSGATAVSAATITSTLDNLCQGSGFNGCSKSTITAQLGSFYAACSNELTSTPNVAVKSLYDVLYVLYPLKQAMCSKGDNGNYCATQLSNSSSTGSGSVALVNPGKSDLQTTLSKYLYTTTNSQSVVTRDASNSTVAFVPNITTYADNNIPFLFLQPSMSSSALCTTCTRNILTPYIDFESGTPYGPNLRNSLLLAGQVPLYNNVTNKCGQNFLSGAVQAAGGLSSGIVSGAAPLAVGPELSAAVSAILGVAAFVAASL